MKTPSPKTGPASPRLTPREILALADAITDLDGILERLSRMDIPTERYGMARGYLEEAQLDLDLELREVMLGEFRLLARALPAPPEAGFIPKFVEWWRNLAASCGGNKTHAFRSFLELVERKVPIPGFPRELLGQSFPFCRPPKGYSFNRLSRLLPPSPRRRPAPAATEAAR